MTPRLPEGWGRALRLTALGGSAALLAGLAIWAAVGTRALADQPCANHLAPLGRPMSTLFVLGSLVAFALGRLLGRFRDFRSEAHLLPLAGIPLRHRQRGTSLLLHVALSAFLLLVVALLAYETWAFLPPDPTPRWTITAFVRCADRTHTIPTLAAMWVVAFFAGHWLWHPLRTRPL